MRTASTVRAATSRADRATGNCSQHETRVAHPGSGRGGHQRSNYRRHQRASRSANRRRGGHA